MALNLVELVLDIFKLSRIFFPDAYLLIDRDFPKQPWFVGRVALGMDDTVEACLSDGAAVHLIVRPDAWTLREAWRVQDAWRWSHLFASKNPRGNSLKKLVEA